VCGWPQYCRTSERIDGGSTAFAGRRLAHRITGAGNNELGSLAAAFNRMAESLQQRDAEIRSNRDQLIESGKLAGSANWRRNSA